MAPSNSYFWAFSTIAKATLIAGTTYNVEALALQSDQVTPILGWKEPQRKGTLRPKPARIAIAMDLSQRADGFWEITWCFPPWTPGQFAYIIANQYSSGTLWSAPATIQTWDDNVNGYSAFQCTALRPVPGQDFDIQDGMYIDVKQRFVGGVLL
jgi:hypothetical protein